MTVYHWGVNRLFSLFPASYCGRALIILRVSAAGTFVMMSTHREVSPVINAVMLIQLLIAVMMIVEFMTLLVSAVRCCRQLSTLFGYPEIEKLSAVFASMNVAALGLFGGLALTQ